MIIGHTKLTKIEILVLSVLGSLSLLTGYFLRDIFVGFGSGYFSAFIHSLPVSHYSVEAEFLPLQIKVVPLIFTAIAFEVEGRFFECK